MCCLQENHCRFINKETKWRDGKNTPCKCKLNKVGVATLLLHKVYIKTKTVTRDKEEHWGQHKGSIQEEDVTIVNAYTPNIRTPQYIRPTLTGIRGDIDSNSGGL